VATNRKARSIRPLAWLAICAVAMLALSAGGPVAAATAGGSADHRQASTGPGKGKAKQRARKRANRLRRRAAVRRWSRRANQRVGVGANVAVAAAPAAAPSDVLDAGFEQGLANWNTAGVGEVVPAVVGDVVRSGARSSYVALDGSQGRSELILGGNGGGSTEGMVEFHEGDEYWYGFSFYIESMVYGGPGAHNLIMQFKSEGEGSPNFGLQLWDYEGDDGESGGRGLWSSGDAMDGDRFLAPVDEQAWHDVVIHFKASRADAGFYEVFLDGQLVDSRSGVSMIRPDRDYAYVKNGLYRNGDEIPGRSELRLDAVRLGRSSSAVAPA
jgi:hypothetical protein